MKLTQAIDMRFFSYSYSIIHSFDTFNKSKKKRKIKIISKFTEYFLYIYVCTKAYGCERRNCYLNIFIIFIILCIRSGHVTTLSADTKCFYFIDLFFCIILALSMVVNKFYFVFFIHSLLNLIKISALFSLFWVCVRVIKEKNDE